MLGTKLCLTQTLKRPSLMNYTSASILTRVSLEFATETTTSYKLQEIGKITKTVFIANMVQREYMCKPVTCVSNVTCYYAHKHPTTHV